MASLHDVSRNVRKVESSSTLMVVRIVYFLIDRLTLSIYGSTYYIKLSIYKGSDPNDTNGTVGFPFPESPFACLVRRSPCALRFQPGPVSGFPLACPIAVDLTTMCPSGRSRWGLPSSSTYLLPLMRRPSDSGGPPHPCPFGCFVLASGTLKPSPSANQAYLEAVPALEACAATPTAYRIDAHLPWCAPCGRTSYVQIRSRRVCLCVRFAPLLFAVTS
jgi:hypothetical protein